MRNSRRRRDGMANKNFAKVKPSGGLVGVHCVAGWLVG